MQTITFYKKRWGSGKLCPQMLLLLLLLYLLLFAIFILHSRESELYRYVLDGKSALAWELPFPGHLSST